MLSSYTFLIYVLCNYHNNTLFKYYIYIKYMIHMKETLSIFKKRFGAHVEKVASDKGLFQLDHFKNIMFSFREQYPGDFNELLKLIYIDIPRPRNNRNKSFRQYLEADIEEARVKYGNINPMDLMLIAIHKRTIVILKKNKICISKLLHKTRIPSNLNKFNYPAYIFTFYYTSLIGQLTHDAEPLLRFVKFVANCACRTSLEGFDDVSIDILQALDFNILCR